MNLITESECIIKLVCSFKHVYHTIALGRIRQQSCRPFAEALHTEDAKRWWLDEAEPSQVLVRADLNVPLDKNQKITDDTRIRAAIPTLKYLLENGAKVLLTSHLVSCGQPQNPF